MLFLPSEAPPFYLYNVDLVADFLVSLGVSPIFELDYMPKSMADCKQHLGTPQGCYYAFHNSGGYKGLVEPPRDYGSWYTLVHEAAQHLLSRYGRETIQKWRFEVWNEPQSFVGRMSFPTEYFKLFNASARALKDVDPTLQVGGPVTAGLNGLATFVQWAANASLGGCVLSDFADVI